MEGALNQVLEAQVIEHIGARPYERTAQRQDVRANHMKSLLPTIATILILLYPLTAAAAFLIQLKNGGELSTDRYWEDADHIIFYAYGGTVGIRKGFVKSIKESNSPYRDGAFEQDKVPEKGIVTGQTSAGSSTVLSPEVTQQPPKEVGQTSNTENKEANLAYYRDKKLELKDQVDKASTRYLEATTNKDLEAQEKARLEMLEFSRQIYKLADELKQKNGGVLPDWWEQL